MKKTIYIILGLILAGILAYYAGYRAYTSERPKTELLNQLILQKSVPISEEKSLEEKPNYYFGKIQQGFLKIYVMPDEILYESVKIDSLQLSEKEEEALTEGIIFQTLTEVFEFLENSMS